MTLFDLKALRGAFGRLALACGLALSALTPAAAQDLRIALTAPVVTLDAHLSALVQSDLSVASHLYSTLVARGPDLAMRGDAAESWRAEGETAWVFSLRPNLRFPNGEALDAEAVRWNMERVLNPQTRSRLKPFFDPIEAMEVLSPTELRFRTRGAYPVLPEQLTMLFLMPPRWTAEGNAARQALGTGPYALREFRPGDRVLLEARPDYYGPRPAFSSIEIRMIAEPSVRTAALLAGELDFAVDLLPSDVQRLNASSRVRAMWGESNRMLSLRFNATRPPMDNRQVRQALSMAIDRNAIIQAAFEGHSTVSSCQLLSPMYFGFNPALAPTRYDPAAARRLLAASGVRLPIELELEIPLGRYLLSQEIGQIIAAQLEEIGVRVQIREMEFGAWVQKYGRGDLGMSVYMGQGWPTLDADGLLSLYHPSNPVAYWNDPIFASAVDRGRTSMDPAVRRAAYVEATQRMCEEAPVAFLFTQPLIYATSRQVSWQARGDDWVRAVDFTRN